MIYLTLSELKPFCHKQVKISQKARNNRSTLFPKTNQSFLSKANWLSFNINCSKIQEEFIEFNKEQHIKHISVSSSINDLDLNFRVDTQKKDDLYKLLKFQQKDLLFIQQQVERQYSLVDGIETMVKEQVLLCGNLTLLIHFPLEKQ